MILDSTLLIGVLDARWLILPEMSMTRSVSGRTSILDGEVDWMRVAWITKGGLLGSRMVIVKIRSR
jgi:hypothetical protein